MKISSVLTVAFYLSWIAVAAAGERANALRAALASADRLVVEEPEFPPPEEKAKAFTINDSAKIAALVEKLDFDDAGSGFHCMCYGDSTVRFFQGEKEIASLSHHHGKSLRWNSGDWAGDSLFTPEAAKAWRTWFKEAGETRFENMHLEAERERMKQAEIERRFMKCFPESAVTVFAAAREQNGDGFVTFSPEHSSVDSKASNEARAFLALFPSSVEMGLAVCKALGSLERLKADLGGWTATSPREQFALSTARAISGADFLRVLERANADELLGAARLFFFEGMSKKLEGGERLIWAAKLSRAVLDRGLSGNAAMALRALRGFQGQETTALLEEVARGEVGKVEGGKELDDDYQDEPGNRAAACLLLAHFGHPNTARLIQEAERQNKLSDLDRGALRVAGALAGTHKIDASIFSINSFTIALGALAALEKQGDKAALDAVISGGTQHMYAAVREESVLVVERLTGKQWFKNGENERAEWHGKEIRKWWETNRETFRLPKRQ